jgi:selenocysteine lyase/cysteine desulfurase
MIMPPLDRRAMIAAALAAAPALGVMEAFGGIPTGGSAPDDEAYWTRIAALYDRPKGVIQLEHGNWGMMARPVMEAYGRHIQAVNRDTSYYVRRDFVKDFLPLRARVAGILGVAPDEIAFTRNATESLQALISGYHGLRAGDAVLYADSDYDAPQSGFRWLAKRRGVQVIRIDLPEPATHQNLIDAYAKALADHPTIRLMLITQVSHRSGLVLPVAEITALARAKGAATILDAAHGWGQIEMTLPALGADFAALNCHKWVGAPLGAGLLYIRKDRLGDIEQSPCEDGGADTVASRAHVGTPGYPCWLAVGDALDFQDAITIKAKAARLHYLRNRWAETLRGVGNIDIVPPADPRLVSAIASFRLKGQTSEAQNKALAQMLLQRFGIFTVERAGLVAGGCVRATPSLGNTVADVDALVGALRQLA